MNKASIFAIITLLSLSASLACVTYPSVTLGEDTFIYGGNDAELINTINNNHVLTSDEAAIILNFVRNGYSVNRTQAIEYQAFLAYARDVNNDQSICTLYRAVVMNGSFIGMVIDRKENQNCPAINLFCSPQGYHIYANDLTLINPPAELLAIIGLGIIVLLSVIAFFWFRRR